MTRKRFSAVAVFAVAALLAVGVSTGLAGGRATDGSTASAGIDTNSAIVQLKGDPLSTYVKTKPAPGKKIDFNGSAVKSYRAQLNALRNDFKQWLKQNAPAAKVTGEFDIALNAVAVQLNGTPLSALASAPMVNQAQYEGLYTPQAIDPDLTLINAFTAWGAGGGAGAGVRADGSRVRVGVIDTGIDIDSPCFNDSGYSYPAGFPKGDTAFTNKKVIVAKIFYNKANVQGLTPDAVQAHGTHVSGTVACDYGLTNATTTVDGTLVGYGVLGVAPGADGMDIVNMSIGGSHGKSGNVGFEDLLMNAIDDLDQAGMISAVAAGNSGPGFNTVESPGAAARALTAGAVTVGHFIGVNVTVGGTNYAAAVGQFGPTAPVSGPLSVVATDGCSPLSGLAAKIALIARGSCTFSTKIRNAQTGGAVGVVIRNNVGGPPISMAQDGTPNQPTIPGVMVSNTTGVTLTGLGGSATTIDATKTYVQALATSNVLAGFSSRGPTDVDFRVKPDVTAPGVNVLSSIPSSGPESCVPAFAAPCWAFFQGTSMATPHLAGSAAVVLARHPSWPAWAVRSAVVNTADENVLQTSNGACCDLDVNDVGSGRENLSSAVGASLALDPVSVSFGAVPSGSGQTGSRQVTVINLTGGTLAVPAPAITGTTGTGVTYSVSGASFSLAAGGTATVTVTMSAAKGASPGAHQAILRFGGLAHAAVFTWIR